MKARVVNFKRIQNKCLKKIAGALKSGAVMICPTDTIYGISVSARVRKSIEKIRRIKKRRDKKPFIILVDSINSAKKITRFNGRALVLAKKFWPGPLTMILNAKTGSKKIAIRIPGRAKLRKLIGYLGCPMVSTSANISGQKPANNEKALIKRFGGLVDYMLLAGRVSGLPSTIVDVSSKKIKIIRQGAVPKRKILDCLENRE